MFLLYFYTVNVCASCVQAYYNMYAEARGLAEAGTPLLSCATWRLNCATQAGSKHLYLLRLPARLCDALSDLPSSAKSSVFCFAIWLLLVTTYYRRWLVFCFVKTYFTYVYICVPTDDVHMSRLWRWLRNQMAAEARAGITGSYEYPM